MFVDPRIAANSPACAKQSDRGADEKWVDVRPSDRHNEECAAFVVHPILDPPHIVAFRALVQASVAFGRTLSYNGGKRVDLTNMSVIVY